MSLDQTLAEIEPIFRGTDGSFQFTHPSFQEVLTARQFADEINSGRLSVKDAYEQFWSYEEDAELWDMSRGKEWRALLPSWKPILIPVCSLLNQDRLNDLITYLLQNCTDSLEESRIYYPFDDDLIFIGESIVRFKQISEPLITKLGNVFNSYKRDRSNTSTISQEVNNILEEIHYLRYGSYSFGIPKGISPDELRKSKLPLDYYDGKYFEPMEPWPEEPVNISIVINSNVYHSGNEYNYVQNLSRNKSEESVNILINYLRKNYFSDVAALGLGKLKAEKAVPYLSEFIVDKSKSEDDRHCAVYALGEIGSKKAVGALAICMNDRNNSDRLRYCSAVALGKIGCLEAEDPLIQYIENKNNPGREHAARALGKIRSKKAVLSLSNYLIDKTNKGREASVLSMEEIKDSRGIPALLKCIEDRDNSSYLRDIACFALKRIGNQDAIKHLQTLFNNPSIFTKAFTAGLIYYTINSIHQNLKPQGYNPPEKRLVA